MLKTRKNFFFLLLTILLVFPFSVQAGCLKTQKNITIAEKQVINDNIYALGKNLSIKGKVKGDVFFLGETLKIEGEVEGEIVGLASQIEIKGKTKNAKLLGKKVVISGEIKQNAYVFSSDLFLAKTASIFQDLLFVSNKAKLSGSIDRNLKSWTSTLKINGKIGGRADLYLNKNTNKPALFISDSARIKDGVFYRSNSKGEISEQAQIGGEVKHKFPQKEKKDPVSIIWSYLISVFSALLIGLVFITLIKNRTLEILYSFKRSSFFTPLKGLGLFLVFPVLSFLLLFTLIGIPLSLLILSGWLIAVLSSRVLVALYLGKTLIKKTNFKKESLMSALILGTALSWLVFHLPLVGWIFNLLAVCWGLGVLYEHLKTK